MNRTATLLAMRLAGLQARLDELTARVRAHPTNARPLFAEIWRTCLAHERTVRALEVVAPASADLARGTGEFPPIRRARVPVGVQPLGKARPAPRPSFPSCWSGRARS